MTSRSKNLSAREIEERIESASSLQKLKARFSADELTDTQVELHF